MNEVRLKLGTYSLKRKRDSMGDSGSFWKCYDLEESKEKGEYVWVEDSAGLIKIGYGIRCGSVSARSYSAQDWWQCGGVTEITEVKEENDEVIEVTFKTGNSIYTARSV